MKRREINRRQFLKKATGVTAGAVAFPYLVPTSAFGQRGRVSPSNRITMGCIGMGGQGTGDMRGFLGKRKFKLLPFVMLIRRISRGPRKSWTTSIRTMTVRRTTISER
ncbi:MAG TPA: twin-arginine translocation signal domain-containing protein [Planctomycetes bacterium]|nr:twin-arginine translocation signal domain-containing protein [Planctomycetota bacterium]